MRCHADPSEVRNHSLGVVVLVGTESFPVGTGDVSRHRLGGIPLPGARGLCHPAIHDQRMAVIHEHMASVAGQCRMGLGFTAQQRVGISAAAVGLVAELDPAEKSIGTLLALLGRSETLAGS